MLQLFTITTNSECQHNVNVKMIRTQLYHKMDLLLYYAHFRMYLSVGVSIIVCLLKDFIKKISTLFYLIFCEDST